MINNMIVGNINTKTEKELKIALAQMLIAKANYGTLATEYYYYMKVLREAIKAYLRNNIDIPVKPEIIPMIDNLNSRDLKYIVDYISAFRKEQEKKVDNLQHAII